MEENHYYPFGLKHKAYNAQEYMYKMNMDETPGYYYPTISEVVPKNPNPYKYKFQGQERQDELGLNWDSFKYRNYDYAIGRFMSIDPLAEKYSYQSSYAFAENKVISHVELEGLEGIHSSLVNGAGNKVHTIEKNVVVLTQSPRSIPEGASASKIERIQRQNARIESANNSKIESTKSELNQFYGGAKNSAGESVNFKFNVSGMNVDNTNAVPSRETTQLGLDNGIESSSTAFDGGPNLIAPAAIISTASPGGDHGTTNGVVVRTSLTAPEGAMSHEVGHTLKLEDNYDGTGVMANPPQRVSPSEVDNIINSSYEKKN